MLPNQILTPAEALSKANGKALSGLALIKEAFALLYRMPADRLVIRPGALTPENFQNGQYIVLNIAGRPVIQPLPTSPLPMVMNIEDIKPAFEALAGSLKDNVSSLHEHALYLSHKALIDAYGIYGSDIPKLLASLSYRFSRTGFTGSPESPGNILCAQLAWLCVDKTKRDLNQQFWKLLYPEATGCYGMIADAHWPAYGECLLDEKLSKGEPGELINYRIFHQDVQLSESAHRFKDANMGEATCDRIKSFFPMHHGFWHCEKNESNNDAAQFQHYEQFFRSFSDFCFKNSITNLGAQYEDKISLEAETTFFKDYHAGLMKFLQWHEQLDYVTKKRHEALLSPTHKTGLITIINNLASNSVTKCLNSTRNHLVSLMDKNEDLAQFLRKIPFDLYTNEESLIGHDKLTYTLSHCSHINKLNIDELVDLIKNSPEIPMRAKASRTLELYDIQDPARLLNFICYINDQKLELEFFNTINENNDFGFKYNGPRPERILSDLQATYSYLRIYERLGLNKNKMILLATINTIANDLARSECYFNGNSIIKSIALAVYKDKQTIDLIIKIHNSLGEKPLGYDTLPIILINACGNNQGEVNQVLKAYEELLTTDNFLYLHSINESKQIYFYNFFKSYYSSKTFSISHVADLIHYCPIIVTEIHKEFKELIPNLIKNKYDFRAIFDILPDEIQRDLSLSLTSEKFSNFIFSDVTELGDFIEKYKGKSPTYVNALEPFIKKFITDLDDFIKIRKLLKKPNTKEQVYQIVKPSILEWITSASILEKTTSYLEEGTAKDIVNALHDTGKLDKLLGTDETCLTVIMFHLDIHQFTSKTVLDFIVRAAKSTEAAARLNTVLFYNRNQKRPYIIIDLLREEILQQRDLKFMFNIPQSQKDYIHQYILNAKSNEDKKTSLSFKPS